MKPGDGKYDERTSQRDLMARKRKSERDIEPRPVKDPARREACYLDDALFLQTYFPVAFSHPFTDAHLEFIEDCRRCMQYGTSKAKAMPRKSGKSTILKYMQLKFALYRELKFPLILCSNLKTTSNALNPLKRDLSSPIECGALHEDFPFECDLAHYVASAPSRAKNVTWGGMPVHMEWGPEHIILPILPDGHGGHDRVEYGLPGETETLGSIVMALPFSSGSVQGLNVYGRRPDFVMLDDLDDRNSLSAEHGRIAEKIEDAIDKTVAGLSGQQERLGEIYICTITSRRSAAYKYTDRKQKPAWEGDRVPAIVAWPKRMDLWDEYCRLRQEGKETGDTYGRIAHKFLKERFDEMHEGAELTNPHEFVSKPLEDGEPEQLSALECCFIFIADNSMEAFLTEYQNDPPPETALELHVEPGTMIHCIGDYEQNQVDSNCVRIVRGVDIRKIEVHHTTIAEDPDRPHQIIDYNVEAHGSPEITVEQAEDKILQNLRRLREIWETEEATDENGMGHSCDFTLIDKGWMGTWVNEEGERKSWIHQPVEVFCMEAGLRRYMPCKGAPNYRSPAPAKNVVIGNRWHMNLGPGQERKCAEIIWDASHWHLLVEELFVLEDDDPDRFELFIPRISLHTNHRKLGQHVTDGAQQLKDEMSRGTRSRKPRFIRDHWWDCLAMALVAQSVMQQLGSSRPTIQKPKAPRPTPVSSSFGTSAFSRGRW